MEQSKHIYHENLMGVYVLSTMLKNYIAVTIKQKAETAGVERYAHNKMDKADEAISKMIAPTIKFLKEVGALDKMEDDILKYHDVIDEVFGMDEGEIKRMVGMIERIKKDRVRHLRVA